MINIICHRGFWLSKEEQNTLVAFKRAFDAGLGVELDVRDCVGSLVVSHDPPGGEYESHLGFTEVLDLLKGCDNILAVNVKSCGLAPWFAKLKPPKNWFFFDMAIPDIDDYLGHNLPIHNPYISNELRGKQHKNQWSMIKSGGDILPVNLVTDYPAEAMEFFK